MKRLYDSGQEVSISNMVLIENKQDDGFRAFLKKHQTATLSEGDIYDILYDPTIDSSPKLFDLAKEELLGRAFIRFVEDSVSELKYYSSNHQLDTSVGHILHRARGIIRIHELIYRLQGSKPSQFVDTKDKVNSSDEYISTSSQALNSYIGGFTRGYVTVIIAKSSHCKSSWLDYNIAHTILAKKVKGKIYKITPEEDAATQWRRYIAMVCKIPMTSMLLKTIKITDEHIKNIEKIFSPYLVIKDDIFKYNDIIDYMSSVKNADVIAIDHINAIDYPGNGTWLNNMIGGIPGLMSHEKRIAKNPNIYGLKPCMINLSQVGDKEIQRSDRILKAPRYFDAYGSSVLYQVSRQMIAFWYPYKDFEDNPVIFGDKIPSISDVYVGIEKSSFSRVGKLWMNFDPELNIFHDSQSSIRSINKSSYIAPQESSLFNESGHEENEM